MSFMWTAYKWKKIAVKIMVNIGFSLVYPNNGNGYRHGIMITSNWRWQKTKAGPSMDVRKIKIIILNPVAKYIEFS